MTYITVRPIRTLPPRTHITLGPITLSTLRVDILCGTSQFCCQAPFSIIGLYVQTVTYITARTGPVQQCGTLCQRVSSVECARIVPCDITRVVYVLLCDAGHAFSCVMSTPQAL